MSKHIYVHITQNITAPIDYRRVEKIVDYETLYIVCCLLWWSRLGIREIVSNGNGLCNVEFDILSNGSVGNTDIYVSCWNQSLLFATVYETYMYLTVTVRLEKSVYVYMQEGDQVIAIAAGVLVPNKYQYIHP